MEPKRFRWIDAAPAWLRILLLAGLAAVACAGAQRLLLGPGLPETGAWPAAGIAFGSGWRWGRRWVLPCAVGAALAWLPEVGAAVCVAVAVSAGSLAGLTVLRTVEEVGPAPDRTRGELQWLATVLGVSAPVQAALGAALLPAATADATGSALRAWLAAWLMVALGMVLLAPLLANINASASRRPFHDPAGRAMPALPAWRIESIAAAALLALACAYAGLLAWSRVEEAQALLVASIPLAAVAALRVRRGAFAPALAVGAVALLAAHAAGMRAAGASVSPEGMRPATGLPCALLLCAVAMARVLRMAAAERRSALERLARLAEQAAALSALDAPGLVAELEARLAAPGRDGFGLIGVRCDAGADVADSMVRDDAALGARSVAAMLARHPESLATAMPAAGWHVMVVSANSVMQLRATARELYSRLARTGGPDACATPRVSIGGLLIEPQAAVGAEDCLGALSDVVAIAGSVRDPRLYVEPLSQTMIDARRAHRDKIEQVREAIREARLELFAQPLDDLDRLSGRMEYEILTRLRDRDGGLIAPAEFLPLAVHARLSGALDRAVVRRAFGWLAQHPDALARTAKCAINLSAASIADPAFAAYAREQRLAHDIVPGKIVFEIAESDVLHDPAAASRLVDEIRADGFGVALDDFGRGLATFEYLRRFPLDYVKIDGAFIRNLATSPIDEEIVLSTIRVARRLSVRTVAEHVHSERILQRLQRLGIDHVQGALIGAPRPLAELFRPDDPHGDAAGSDTVNGDATGGLVAGEPAGVATPG